jgi:hypothetical protein
MVLLEGIELSTSALPRVGIRAQANIGDQSGLSFQTVDLSVPRRQCWERWHIEIGSYFPASGESLICKVPGILPQLHGTTFSH